MAQTTKEMAEWGLKEAEDMVKKLSWLNQENVRHVLDICEIAKSVGDPSLNRRAEILREKALLKGR